MESLEKRKAERKQRTVNGPEGVVIEADKKGSEKELMNAVNPNQEIEGDPVRNLLPGASQIPDGTASFEHKVKGDDKIASSQPLIDAAEAAAAGNGGGDWSAAAPAAKKTSSK